MGSWQQARARVARAVQTGDREAERQARADLKMVRAEEYIRRLIAEEPPLSRDQARQLAALLTGGEA